MERLIGVVGYECEDITIYLAGILCALRKKVAIIDRTEQEMLCEMLGMQTNENGEGKEREYCGIWITNKGICTDEFEVVFYVFGYRLEHPKMYECEALLLITDGVPAHASLLSRINNRECRRYLLIRNLVALKHTVDYLVDRADDKAEYVEIPYDEKDVRERCGLCGYGRIGIRQLSGGMKKALLELVKFLTDEYSQKEIRAVMKKM